MPATTLSQAPVPPYVWYASYGSNLTEARFNCYLRGGRVEGMATDCAGARDPSPPTHSTVLRVPHPVFFGQLETPRWGVGGVAFLDPVGRVEGVHTVLRAYRVTLEQFNDIVAQENRLAPPLPGDLQLTTDMLHQLPGREHASLQLVPKGWYGQLKWLGTISGDPVLTFTCPLEDREAYRLGLRQPFVRTPPSQSYYAMLHKGLLECGLDGAEAHTYLNDATTVALTDEPPVEEQSRSALLDLAIAS